LSDWPSREVGRFGEPPAAGEPTLLVVGGLHGNEPAGLHAARRVIDRLACDRPPCRGRIVALAGNLRALARRQRFIDEDLNRLWTVERVIAGHGGIHSEPATAAGAASAEEGELVELLAAIRSILAEAKGPMYVIDLHTTSSVSSPFALFADTLPNRRFARRFPLPLVLGLEEQIEGAMLNYLGELGCVCLGVEGGQHQAATSVDNLEAVLWVALEAVGMILSADLPDLGVHRDRLDDAQGGLPRALEVCYRHAIAPEDDFRMIPGFVNFQPVTAGQCLARDHRGPIRARENGRILMPLYQGQGDDGYFMTRAVHPLWLDVSSALRRLRLSALLPLLPGVRRHPTRAGTLVIDTRVARLFPLQILHLFGYRKLRWESERLMVSRRSRDR